MATSHIRTTQPSLSKSTWRWFNHYLKGEDNGVESDPPVRYYDVMGAVDEENAPGNFWREAEDFPPPADETSFYLRAGGDLSQDKPEDFASTTSYTSDPFHLDGDPRSIVPGAKDARVRAAVGSSDLHGLNLSQNPLSGPAPMRSCFSPQRRRTRT
ncbi:MAG: CocE/NonD family hydrolase C-terminal non-catalytic domain-containing protein [Planctomycetaceae bacterium]